MRTKLLGWSVAAVLGFLLVTNPVVADAAGQITGAQIKDNSVASKDVKDNDLTGRDLKNGSVKRADLATGVVPAGVTIRSFHEFHGGSSTYVEALRKFLGTTTSVTVEDGDVVAATGSMDLTGQIHDDFWYTICARATGATGEPSPIGGLESWTIEHPLNGSMTVSRSVSGVLAAGTYDVGMCGRVSASNNGITSYAGGSGYVLVLDNVG